MTARRPPPRLAWIALVSLLSLPASSADTPASGDGSATGYAADGAGATPDKFDGGDEPAAERKAKVWVRDDGPKPLGAVPPAVLEAALAARDLPLAARLKAVTDPFLEAHYVADPLGEGQGVDADPLARYDVFDCLTFVEEALALALAGDPEHATSVRLGLRYGQHPATYANRRHFMELQWIPGNIADGWLVDTTADYGDTVALRRTVDATTWARWGPRKNFALTDEQLPSGEMALDVLPLDTALAVVDRIRPGSIVLTVRADRASKPLWISHVGFTIPADQPTVRHATRMGRVPRVRDHSLRWYVEHLSSYRGWEAVGIAILEPVEQLPRPVAATLESTAVEQDASREAGG